MNKIYKNLRYRWLEWKATRLPWESEQTRPCTERSRGSGSTLAHRKASSLERKSPRFL